MWHRPPGPPALAAWLWAAAAGGWTVAVCALLARGAERPLLALLGSAFWAGVGALLARAYARGLARLDARGPAAPGAPGRAPVWPALAPVLAATLAAAGGLRLALQVGTPATLGLAAGLGTLLAATVVLALGGRRRGDARRLQRAVLVAGLPATALGLAAPLHAWLAGWDPAGVVRSFYAFAFGVIPGLWCAAAWLWGEAAVRGRRAAPAAHPPEAPPPA